jgi:hypothetical protein
MVRKSSDRVAAVVAKKSELVIHDVQQGSDEWFQTRLGIVTASHFATVMADGRDGDPSETRSKLMHRLAGEEITGIPAEETFKSRAMERGKEMEADAIADYERRNGVSVRRVGFATNFSGLKRCGASPDGLVGFDGGVETKTMRPDLMIPLLLKGAQMVAAHRAQVMGNMLVWEREWWDLKIFYPRMPDFTFRIYRDETYIRNLHNEIERFNFEKRRMIETLRKMGAEV